MGFAIRLVVPRHRMGVEIVALDGRGRVLMLRHVFHPFAPWGLPGGWLGRNEAPGTCGLRELQEETGLTGRLGPVLHIARDPNGKQLNVAYLAHVTPGPMTLSAEIIAADWFFPDALPGPLLPFTEQAIAAALQRERMVE
jgi:ADP-ribose pyrophosphatase YjhB (NUDIX family)